MQSRIIVEIIIYFFSTTKIFREYDWYGILGNVYLSEEFYDRIEFQKSQELTPILKKWTNKKTICQSSRCQAQLRKHLNITVLDPQKTVPLKASKKKFSRLLW
jgi:hypothetical protein